MGSLFESMTSPEMRHTSVELTKCAIGTSLASTRMSSWHVGQSTLVMCAEGGGRGPSSVISGGDVAMLRVCSSRSEPIVAIMGGPPVTSVAGGGESRGCWWAGARSSFNGMGSDAGEHAGTRNDDRPAERDRERRDWDGRA